MHVALTQMLFLFSSILYSRTCFEKHTLQSSKFCDQFEVFLVDTDDRILSSLLLPSRGRWATLIAFPFNQVVQSLL